MNIVRRATTEGYTLDLVCERCFRIITNLDAQGPLWTVVVAYDDHWAQKHTPRVSDDAVGLAYYQHPDKNVEDLTLGCGRGEVACSLAEDGCDCWKNLT